MKISAIVQKLGSQLARTIQGASLYPVAMLQTYAVEVNV